MSTRPPLPLLPGWSPSDSSCTALDTPSDPRLDFLHPNAARCRTEDFIAHLPPDLRAKMTPGVASDASLAASLNNAALTANVGPGQPNKPNDVTLVQRLLNEALARGYIKTAVMPPDADGPGHTLAVNGQFLNPTYRAIVNLEILYFHGRANPHGIAVLEPKGALFTFLLELVRQQRVADQRLAVPMEELADKMLPTGKSGRVSPTQVQNVKLYLPLLLDALTKRNLNDTGMVLITISNIAAESSNFAPVDEGISKYNTPGYRSAPTRRHSTGVFIPTGSPFSLYDNKKNIGNTGAPDGADFKGRGFTQLTGRYNYTQMSKDLGTPGALTKTPELADDPKEAADIMAQYLKDRETSLRDALKRNDLHMIRATVNGKAELGYATFRTSFNAGRALVGEKIITEAEAVAARATRPVKPRHTPKKHTPHPAPHKK